jgi:hypothetical protein
MKARTISALVIAIVVATGLLTIATGQARAAYYASQYTTFECGAGSVTVYLPRLYTVSGLETAYYSPDLWRHTDGAWAPYITTAPWYGVTVRPDGVMSWYTYPQGNHGVYRIPFWNLPPGWYAVKGYFYQGSEHWGTVWGPNSTITNSTMCRVS